MKKFLEVLKKELQKNNVNSEEIVEIIKDHEEMLEDGLSEGLKEEEIINRFGNPKDLALELAVIRERKDKTMKNGYELVKEFQDVAVFKTLVKVVSDDVIYEESLGNEIKVYAKDINNIEDYEIFYNDGEFILKQTKEKSVSFFSKKSGKFIVEFPMSNPQYKEFFFSTVSGDFVLEQLNCPKCIITSTSGDAKLKNINTINFKVKTVSGDVSIEETSTNDAELNTVSGDVSADKFNVANDMYLNTVSGDIDLTNAKCDKAIFTTVSGDLIGKEFYLNDLSFKSVSGDAKIENENKEHEIKISKKKSVSGKVTIK
jgi:DUF4097 and DUF4098 domain-containing protein YvlB